LRGTVVVLAFFSLPHLGEAWHNMKPLSGGFWHNWNGFVGIVLAVSGVEAIANATSVMKLDRGSSEERPSVRKTSTPAIFSVVLEVSIFTALLGLGMHALGGLQIDHGDVNAPGHPGVRDYMLRYMAEIFVGGQFGPIFGQAAGWIVTVVFGFLFLSAVNTAIVDLIAISFLMSRDGELPPRFEKLNGFGGGSRKITYLCIRRSDIEETCSRRIQNLSACKSLNGFPPVSTFAIRKSESNPSGTVLEKLMDPGKDHRPFHI
jgi:amino acid transporter